MVGGNLALSSDTTFQGRDPFSALIKAESTSKLQLIVPGTMFDGEG